MKVLIADDHEIVRFGTKMLLRSKYQTAEIHESGGLVDVFEKVRSEKFDLLVLDVHMSQITSVVSIRNLLVIQPTMKIIVLSQMPEEIFGIHYIKAGAKGYVDKRRNYDSLSKAINTVVEGRVYITQEIQDELVRLAVDGNGNGGFARLSERELDVLALMLKGESTSSIGIKLNLQSTTISTYKNRIFEKLGTTNPTILNELVSVLNLQDGR